MPRLQSRRNKRAVRGRLIPGEYVNSRAINAFNENLFDLITSEAGRVKSKLILSEIALNLMLEAGKIACKSDPEDKSLVWMLINQQIDCGCFSGLFSEFLEDDLKIQEADAECLLRVKKLGIPNERGKDLLGLVYMTISHRAARISNGTYYTPGSIVEKLVPKGLHLVEREFPRILDPCCGSGNFLLTVFLALKSNLVQKGLPPGEAEKLLLEECIFGFDIDSTAVWLCRVNLLLLCDTDFVPGNWHIQCDNALMGHSKKISGKFDLIIGNPPWGSDFSGNELTEYRKRYATARASFDSFSIFIEYALKTLNERGIVAYILPESILKVRTHLPVRKILLDETHIESIEKLGNQFSRVFAPAISLLARKTEIHDSGHQIQIENIDEKRIISQKRFADHHLLFFNIWSSEREHRILKHMDNLEGKLNLKDFADFALGIVTGNNKELVFNQLPEGGEPVLTGSQVYKYNYYTEGSYFVFKPEIFQQTAPEAFYRVPEKIVYRFINENLVFAYDDRKVAAINSVNVLIPHLPGYSVKYILAILNSRAVQFFYTYTYASVKVLRTYLESIPIPPCNENRQSQITGLVDKLLASNDSLTRQNLYEELDRMIMQLYGFNEADRSRIIEKTGKVKYLSKEGYSDLG